jgi:enoyl-CoA hydratase
MNQPLQVELGRVCRIVLNRPEKQNAMSSEMGRAMLDAVEQINATSEARLVVLEGAGRAFCAGGDFEVLDANTRRAPAENRLGMLEFYRSFLSIVRVRVPTLAKIHGPAVGAGLCLAMACDLRLAAVEAKLGANFVRVGLHPGMGCTLLLPRLVGAAKATELILTGKLVSGEEAARIGLVNAAVARDALDMETERLIEELTRAAPIAAMQAKATLLTDLLKDLEETLHREANAQAIDFATADLREAVAAFRAGRSPQFSGQ